MSKSRFLIQKQHFLFYSWFPASFPTLSLPLSTHLPLLNNDTIAGKTNILQQFVNTSAQPVTESPPTLMHLGSRNLNSNESQDQPEGCSSCSFCAAYIVVERKAQ